MYLLFEAVLGGALRSHARFACRRGPHGGQRLGLSTTAEGGTLGAIDADLVVIGLEGGPLEVKLHAGCAGSLKLLATLLPYRLSR